MVSLVESKGGIWNVAKRVCMMIRRYGLGSAKMKRNIAEMNALCLKYGINPTFFITLTKCDLDKSKLDVAVHGWQHIRYAQQTQLWQTHLSGIIALGKGFRAPYLNILDSQIVDLSKYNFDFDSSRTFVFPLLKSTSREYQISLDMYKPDKSNMPYFINGLVEIPVSLPDDEMMIDRLHLTEDEIFLQMMSMLDQCYRDGTMLILNLHAERYPLFKNALEKLLQVAKSKGDIWMTDLPNITKWVKEGGVNVWPLGYKCVCCITSDIDRLSLW